MNYILWIGLVYALFLNGCATVNISTDYDPFTDFSRYHTYAWTETEHAITGDIRVDNALLDARIKRTVNHQLAQLGITYDGDKPDFWIRYNLTIEEKTEINTIHDYYDYPFEFGWHYGYFDYYGFGVSTHVYEEHYDELTLVIEFIDTATDTLIWQGIAQDDFDLMTTAKQKDKKITDAVTGMLAPYGALIRGD